MSLPKPTKSNGYTWHPDNKLDKETLDLVTNDIDARLKTLETTARINQQSVHQAVTDLVNGIYNDSVAPEIKTTTAELATIRTSIQSAQDNLVTLQAGGIKAEQTTITDIDGLEAHNVQMALELLTTILHTKASIKQVEQSISQLIAGAPNTLNTLNELATALNDDAGFAANITKIISKNKTDLQTAINKKANQSDVVLKSKKAWWSLAKAGEDNDHWMTPLRVNELIDHRLDHGTNHSKLMSSQDVSDRIHELTVGNYQTWQDVSNDRKHANTVYQNKTHKPICVNIFYSGDFGIATFQVSSDKKNWVTVFYDDERAGPVPMTGAIIPPRHYYRSNITGRKTSVRGWAELR